MASEYLEIANFPTTLSADSMRDHLSSGAVGVHESVLRSYQILMKVKELLSDKVPQKTILQLIEIMESV